MTNRLFNAFAKYNTVGAEMIDTLDKDEQKRLYKMKYSILYAK
jgi:hypothetical protein